MKITWRMLVLAALALALTGGAEAVPASAKPAPGVQLQLTYSSVSGISGMAGGIAQIKNGVSYMPANLVTVMGLEIKWNNADKTATFSGWNKSFSMKLGQSTGVLDGKKVSLGGTPYVADKQLYVPVKFVVAALEGGLYDGMPSRTPSGPTVCICTAVIPKCSTAECTRCRWTAASCI